METVLFIVQCGNGGAAMKAGNHASQKSAGGGGAAGSASAAAELPEGVSKETFGNDPAGDTIYSFREGDNYVQFDTDRVGGQQVVGFTVNGRYTAQGQLSSEEGTRVATKISRIMRHDASNRPDGFVYATSAATGDALGLHELRFTVGLGFH